MEPILLVFSLVLIGFGLLAVEVFVIPGFGVVGVGGLLVLGGAGYLAWDRLGEEAGIAVIASAIVLSLLGAWWLGRTRAARRMVLEVRHEGQASDRELLFGLVGHRGEATSALRPSGTALIDGRRYPVMTDGEYVRPGTPIEVVRAGTNVLVVAPVVAGPDREGECSQ